MEGILLVSLSAFAVSSSYYLYKEGILDTLSQHKKMLGLAKQTGYIRLKDDFRSWFKAPFISTRGAEPQVQVPWGR